MIPGAHLAHRLHRRLVGEEVAAVNGVVEVLPGGVAFALQILGRVDAALRAYRVRALDRHDGKQIDLAAHFGDLDSGREARQSAADDDDSWICHCNSSLDFPPRIAALRLDFPPRIAALLPQLMGTRLSGRGDFYSNALRLA